MRVRPAGAGIAPPAAGETREVAVSEGSRRSSPRGAGHHRMPFSTPLPRRKTRRSSWPGWVEGRGSSANWFALLLLVALTVRWIGGAVLQVIVGALAAFTVWPDAGWALGAIFALACIASLAGWLDRLHQ